MLPVWHLCKALSFLALDFQILCGLCWESGHEEDVLTCMRSYPKEDIRQYPKVTEYLDRHKVYLSLTTSPKRIDKICLTLRSLDLEHVETIFLSLPEKYKDKELYQIPDKIFKEFPKLKLIRRFYDLGPIMKLIPAAEEIQKLGDQEALLITVDDDIAYLPGTIGQLIKAAIEQDVVVGGRGAPLKTFGLSKFPEPNLVEPQINIVEGFGAVAYRVKFLDAKRMRELSQTGDSNYCRTSDDLVISWSLAEKKIPRMKIANAYTFGFCGFKFGEEEDALHHGSGCTGQYCDNNSRYQACAEALYELSKK